MEFVKIFTDDDNVDTTKNGINGVEKRINEWLAENNGKIEIVQRLASCFAGERYTYERIIIFYRKL